MNVRDYIESGILEAYVLDALTPEEKVRVEGDIARHPELASEVRAIEDGMYAFAQVEAEPPPVALKEKIWHAITKGDSATAASSEDNTGKVIPIPSAGRATQVSWQRAAVIAVLIGSLLTNVILWMQRNTFQDNTVSLKKDVDSLVREQQTLVLAVENYRKEKDMMADTAMQPVLMRTMQPGQSMAATVYWAKQKGETYLALQKLPVPPTGKQYQMWVIQDGKPVSMGIIGNDMVEKGMVTLLPMQVTNGQAFAISLEKEGGSLTPTMEQIQVLGKPILN